MAKNSKALARPSVAKGALRFGLGTLSSRILGLIRDILIASCLPLDLKDAWLAAFRLPNIFRRLLGEGGLSAAFIPQFVKSSEKGQRPAPGLVNGTFTLVFLLSFMISALAIFIIPWVVPIWLQGKGFSQVPGKVESTVFLAQIMFFFLLCMTCFSYFMALLNGLKKFSLTGFAPSVFNIVLVIILLVFQGDSRVSIYAAWAVLGGGLAQAAVLVPSLRRTGYFPQFSLSSMLFPEVRRVIKKFMPTLLGVGVVQALTFINLYFASQLPQGTVTYMYLADRLLELPLSLIGVSLGTALLPTLSDHWAEKKSDVFTDVLFRNLRIYLFLALPAAGGLFFLGPEIIQLLYVRGEFTQAEVLIVSDILKVYGLTLLSAGSLRLFNMSFYATEDTRTPAYISLGGLVVHCLMAPFWMDAFGVIGLCFSTALALFFNLIVAMGLFKRKHGKLGSIKLLQFLWKTLVCALAMCGFLAFAKDWIPLDAGKLSLGLVLFLIIGLAALLYFAMAHIFRVEEGRRFTGFLLNRK